MNIYKYTWNQATIGSRRQLCVMTSWSVYYLHKLSITRHVNLSSQH